MQLFQIYFWDEQMAVGLLHKILVNTVSKKTSWTFLTVA